MATGRLLTTREMAVLLVLGVGLVLGGLALYVRYRVLAPGAAVSPVSVGAHESPGREGNSPVQPASAGFSDSPAVAVPEVVGERGAVVVSAAGAVNRPGAYELDPEARVGDLIEAAGGASSNADLSDINLAARLIDGSTLVVPFGSTAEVKGDKLILRKGDSAGLANPAQYTISGWRQEYAAPAGPVLGSGNPGGAALPRESSGLIDLNRASAEELETLPGIGPKLAQAIVAYRSQTPFNTVDDLIDVGGIGPKRLEAIRPFVVVK